MFYDNPVQAVDLAEKSGFSIFVDQNSDAFLENFSKKVPQSQITHVEPGKNHKITVDQIREIVTSSQNRQTKARYIIIAEADRMNESAQNAFLKLLEEPPENYHFVLRVRNATSLFPTVLSRGDLYYLRVKSPLSTPVIADETIKSYAKQLISTKSSDVVPIINRLVSEKFYKKDSRSVALAITNCAIEILYKSYFKTKKLIFLKKLPNFITLSDSLKQNGHIKLHLIADLC